MDNTVFKIKPGYQSRPANNVGFYSPDAERAQYNVYQYAARIARAAKVESVMDWGCGTGGKLIKLLGQYKTIGVDVPECIARVKERMPERKWVIPPVPVVADLVLCADVIEHLEDPRELLQQVKVGQWRHFVISTPERDLVRGKSHMGPPTNKWHAREWNRAEFTDFLRQELGVEPKTVVLGKWNLVAHLERIGG